MTSRIALPSGLVTFVFTDIEGSTRLAQMLGAVPAGARRSTGGCCAPRSPRQTGWSCSPRATRSSSPSPTPAPRSPPASPPSARSPRTTGRPEPDAAGTDGSAHRLGRAVRRGVRQRPRCTGPPGSPRPRTAGRCSAPPPPPAARRARRTRACSTWACTGCAASTAGNGSSSWSRPGLERDFPRPRTVAASAHNLPAPTTSFIGRAAERADRARLLGAHRLVTVVGAGGAGKTRLAVEVAGELVDAYPDGVWFVDLAAMTDPGLVAFAVAEVLGIRPEPGRPVLADPGRLRQRPADADRSRHLRRAAGRRRAGWSPGCSPAPAIAGPGHQPRAARPARRAGLADPAAVASNRPEGAGQRRRRPAAGPRRRGARRPAPRADEIADLLRVAQPAGRAAAGARARRRAAAGALRRPARRTPRRPPRHARRRDTVGQRGPSSGRVAPSGPAARHATLQATVDLVVPHAEPGAPPGCCAGCRSSPARSTWPPSSGCTAATPLDPLAMLVDKSLLHAEPGDRTDLPDARPDPGVRGAAAASTPGGAGGPGPARGLVAAGAAPGPPDADGTPVTLSLYALDPLADEVRAALHWTATGGTARQGLRLAARWTTGGGSGAWPGRAGCGCSASTAGSPRPASASREPSSPRVPRCIRCTPAPTASTPSSCASPSGPRRPPGGRRRRAASPGCSPAAVAPLIDMGRDDEAEQACREVIDWAGSRGGRRGALRRLLPGRTALAPGALDEAAELLAAARALERPTRPTRPAHRRHAARHGRAVPR